ncbi:MAG TPA: HD domain-containing phosphohydrolase, partial [Bryobacteraceae bacterium]|nr:HD domain-containing phosphohydrolase [Bryobacteraceae bacterium]
MSLAARVCLTFIVTMGTLAIFSATSGVAIGGSWRFLIYLVTGLVASGLKVHLPGITGTMSVNFLFILAAIVDLTLEETLIIATGCVIVQYAWQARRRLRLVQALFNFGSVFIAVTAAYRTFHSSWHSALGLDYGIILAIAASVYFAMNTLPVAMIVSFTEGKSIRGVWRDCYFWSFPYYLVGAALVGGMHLLETRLGWQTAILVLPVVYMIFRSYRLYLGRLESEKKHAEEMAGLHLRTIEALALAIEAKDHTTNDHLHRVQVYAYEIARELGLGHNDIEALRAASLLHDIGKLAVPEHIISKPGRLTPEEFEKMKIHPVVGAEILERVQFPYPVVPIVAAHHERWDGSGYPHGLVGEQIPIGARILAAVDCLDALASHRQYRRALPLDEAMQLVKSQSGIAFDPTIVEILERRYIELEQLARDKNSEKTKLSTNVRIARGAAPAAGFEEHIELPETARLRRRGDFLSSIAAARHEVQILFEMSQTMGSSLSLGDTLSVVAKRLHTIVPYDGLAIYLKRGGVLEPEYVTGDDCELFSSLTIPVGQGLSGWVAENGKPILNGNPSVEPGYLNDEKKFSVLRSALSVPLEGVGGIIGVISLYHSAGEAYTRDHLRILLAISSKLGLSIENSLRFREAEDNAVTDFLTNLPNGRSLFVHLEQEIARCKRSRLPLAVLVSDLDGFKQINDMFGHLEGNRILRRVGSVLRQVCRDTDYVARMGGDEFVIVLPGIADEELGRIIQRLRDAVAESGRREFGEIMYTLSVGASQLAPDLD